MVVRRWAASGDLVWVVRVVRVGCLIRGFGSGILSIGFELWVDRYDLVRYEPMDSNCEDD